MHCLISSCLSTTEDTIDILVKAAAEQSEDELRMAPGNLDELVGNLFARDKEEDADDPDADDRDGGEEPEDSR